MDVEPKPTWGSVALGSFSDPGQVAFINAVYSWMFGGLVVTAAVAYWVYMTPMISQFIIGNLFAFYALLIMELIAVIFLASMVHKISAASAALVFLVYAILNGLTFSVIFFIYTIGSIGVVFIITAAMFGGMSIYGRFTKRDLTTAGQFAGMALFGIIIAMIVNIFFQNDMTSMILSGIGVLVFVILTAYDTQKLQWLYELGRTEGDDGEKKKQYTALLYCILISSTCFLTC